MAAAERRRGRRDNGLDAPDWRAVDDLDPRLSEYVLDLLASQGIAAYVQPAVDVDPVTRSATLPSTPRDRLFVDRRHAAAARESLRRFLAENREAADDWDPGGGPGGAGDGGGATGGEPPPATGTGTRSAVGKTPADIDATFAEIVSRLGEVWPDPTAEPVMESTTEVVPEPPPATGPVDGRSVTEPSLLDALDTFGADLPDEPAERFVPPPPPPLPRLSTQTVLGALAVLVGLVLVIARPDAVPLDSGATMLLGLALMLGGATALIMRLRADPDDTHPDDGARL